MTGHMINFNMKIVEAMIDQARYMMDNKDIDSCFFDMNVLKNTLESLSISPADFCFKFYGKTPTNASFDEYVKTIGEDTWGERWDYPFEEFFSYIKDHDEYVYPVRFVEPDGTLFYRLCEIPDANEEEIDINAFFTMIRNCNVEKYLVNKDVSKYIATNPDNNTKYKITAKKL